MTQKDVVRLIANVIFVAIIWGVSRTAGVEIFGDRWAGLDICFRVAFYWCALNIAGAAFRIDVDFVSLRHPDFSLFQCMFWVSLYHVGALVAAIIITLRQVGIIDVSVLGAVLLTLAVVAAIVVYNSLGLFVASLKEKRHG